MVLEDSDLDATFQIVGFHPQYLFAGEDPSDPSHMTNRSPYPMIHVIRRQDMEKAIAAFGDTNQIPENNIKLLRSLYSSDK